MQRTPETLTVVPVNLEEEIDKSGLRPCEVQDLKTYSLGLVSAVELLRTRLRRCLGEREYGLSINSEHTQAAFEILNLKSWLSFCVEQQMTLTEYPMLEVRRKMLPKMTELGRKIVFFVPQNTFSHPRAGVTRAELEYFTEHPDRSSQTCFAFGLFACIRQEELENIGNEYDRCYAIREAFLALRG